MRFSSAVTLASIIAAPYLSADVSTSDRKELHRILERLDEKQASLDEEIRALKQILGLDDRLAGLDVVSPEKGMRERVRIRLEDGIKAYKQADYDAAKDSFHQAWEEEPEHAITNYNLGLAYHKQGNLTLARKMLRSALDKRSSLDKEGRLTTYLEGEESSVSTAAKSPALDQKRTQLRNLNNEAESYLRSQALDLPKKMAKTDAVLEEMRAIIGSEKELKQDYLLDIADRYSAMERYDLALRLYHEYEAAMSGKVLPEDFFQKMQDVEQRQESLQAALAAYMGNVIDDRPLRRKVERDLEELKIFAAQMDRFVRDAEDDDSDFRKICRRLKEFRWGGRSDRHVIVVSRNQELLYSSLKGTLSLDRYQDVDGQQFLKNITLLADRLDLKQAEHFEVDLSIRNERVPYLVYYTYVPKHEAFIIVRVPKRDLVG